MTIHERALARVRALQAQCGGKLPPDADHVVRYYVGAQALYDRAAEHVLQTLAREGMR